MNIKVSIIIPVYNTEKYLKQCLDSIINQTLKEIEIICVNDGSTDNSAKILEEYAKKDKRIKIINKTNEGPAIARNTGMNYATGEYISFVDSDDFISNNTDYEKLYQCGILNNAEIVSANLNIFFEGDNEIHKSPYITEIKDNSPMFPQDYGNPWYYQKNLFKRTFLLDHDLKFPNYRIGEDPVFLAKALTKAKRMHGVAIDFYNYKVPSYNKINTKEKEIGYIKHFKEVIEILKFNKFEKMSLLYKEQMFDFFIRQKFDSGSETLEKNVKSIFGKNSNTWTIYSLKKEMKLKNIKVSIIIPVYNVENYLRQCLDSVVNQTLKEIEIICVNDGSTDNSAKILEEYAKKDKRIKIINKKNAGLGAARNTGMEYATGEYIGFIDSDDWVDTSMYEKLYKNAKSHNSDMVMCPIHVFSDTKDRINHNLSYFSLQCFDDNFDNRVFDYKETKDFIFSINVTAFNKIYKTEFIKYIDAKFPEGLIFEDNPFFFQTYLNARRVSLIRDSLIHYRVNRADSIISSADKRWFDIFEIENQSMTFFASLTDYKDYKINFIRGKIFRIVTRYFEVDKEYKEEFFKLVKKDFEKMNLTDAEVDDLKWSQKNYLNVMNSNSYKEFELIEKEDKAKENTFEFTELEFYELESAEFPLDELFALRVNFNDIKYEFLIRFSSTNKNLICFGSDAYNPDKFALPAFNRYTWQSEFEESVIYYNDPTLYNNPRLTIGWGVGKNDEWYLPVIANIIRILAYKNDINSENILFFGSSAGGFMSIILSTLIKNSSAIVNNPQIFLLNYWRNLFENMIQACFDNFDLEKILAQCKHKFDALEMFKHENHMPPINYIVNVDSEEDILNQLIPFISGLDSFELFKDQLNIYLYSAKWHDNPHNAVLGKEETINLIKNHFNKVNQLPITHQFYVPEKEATQEKYILKQLTNLQNKHLNELINLEIGTPKGFFKVSIIIPVFNAQDYIHEALESIIRQSIDLEHLEVVMVDDCSTDQSGKIIDEYASKYENFKAIHLSENSGNAGKPRNVGIENSAGEYLMFLDPDDFYSDDMCETLYNKIVEEDVDVVFCNFNQYYPNGKLERSYLPSFGNSDEVKVENIDDNPEFLDIFRIWTVILKRDFIFGKDIRFDENILAEDRLFLVETFLEAKGIIYLQNYFGTNYRLRSPSDKESLSSATSKKALMDRVEGYIKTYDLLKCYKKEEYLPYALKVREFWTDRFIQSDLNFSEKEEILKKIAFLFIEYQKFNINPYKYYMFPLFDHIVQGRFYQAVLLADVLKGFINTQEQLQEQLQKEKNKILEERSISNQFNELNHNMDKLKKQNMGLKNQLEAYRSRKVVKTADKLIKAYRSPKLHLKNNSKQKTDIPKNIPSPSEEKNKPEVNEQKENPFSQFLHEQKEIEKLKSQNVRLKNLVEAYRSRKVVRTADKIKNIFKQKTDIPKNIPSPSEEKNKPEVNEQKENPFSQFLHEQKEIEKLKSQNVRLKNLVEAYRSRKVVRTADKLIKAYRSPKSYLKNNSKQKTDVPKNTSQPKNKIDSSKPTVDCADFNLTNMKSKFTTAKLYKTGLKRLKDIKIAVIFDEFSYNSFKHEFNAIPIEPSNWLEIFENEKPDLFLCESAWHGIDPKKEVWKDKIYLKDHNKSENRVDLFNILEYCNKNGIPAIFWNKEDPTDFNTFYSTALKFDHIFTTSEECIQKYKGHGHKNVHCLMFAGQPKLFNPIERQERSEDIVFAGSWYNRFPQRCKEMKEIFDNILDSGFKLKIYDRNYHSIYPAFKFPEEYDEFINPAVPFNEIEKVYKESKFALSFNTITNSNSMFSRRVFELILSNTLVLSNYSKGMHNLFGDNVIIIDKNKIDLSNSDEKRINNLYNVLKNHTYTNRVKQILDTINYSYLPEDNAITIYYVINSQSEIEDVLEHYEDITYKNKKLTLLFSENIPTSLYQKYTNKEASVYSLNYFINQNGIISDITPYFTFANLQLEPDFIEKAMLHYSYIENKPGIMLGENFAFKKVKDLNNIIFHNKRFMDVFNSIFKDSSIEFTVYTVKTKPEIDKPIISLQTEASSPKTTEKM